MNEKKKLKLISKLKYTSLQLRVYHQLPLRLVYYINKVDDQTSDEVIDLLKTLSEHYLRVRGYYKKYPLVENESNNVIDDLLKSKFTN